MGTKERSRDSWVAPKAVRGAMHDSYGQTKLRSLEVKWTVQDRVKTEGLGFFRPSVPYSISNGR